MTEAIAVPTAQRLAREEAFARLVAQELAGAYRTATVLLGDAAEAEDATQDALVRAWQRWDRLRDPGRAGAWFGRILVNVCRDRLRARRTVAVRWLPDPTAVDPLDRSGERETLWEALATLSADHRIVIVLRYYLELPLEAIAERTGVPIGTVKSRLHHALRARPRRIRRAPARIGGHEMNESTFEDALRATLRAAAPLDVPDRLEDRARAIPRVIPRPSRWWPGPWPAPARLALGPILLAFVVVASVVLVADRPSLTPGGGGMPNPADIVSSFGALSASDLELEVGGRIFQPAVAGPTARPQNRSGEPSGAPSPMAAGGVPSSTAQPVVPGQAFSGSSTYGQLTVHWLDATGPMVLVMRFAADAHTWWVSEIIATDGRSVQAGWLYFEGPFFERPLGTTFTGTVTLTSARATYDGETASLRFGDLNLRAFASTAPRNPTAGTMPPPGSSTVADGGPDFITTIDVSGTVVGYIPLEDLQEQVPIDSFEGQPPDLPVYGHDLRTLVGYSVPGQGLVPLASMTSVPAPTASVGPTVVSQSGVIGYPGAFDPGQPLHCSGVQAMTPPDAGAWLAAQGYTVTWQIEDQDNHTSTQSGVAPTTGYVIDGVLRGADLLLVVETGAAAQAVPSACH